MANEYFTAGSVPVNGAPGSAAIIRQEFAQIEASFNKLPVLAGKAGSIVVVNSTGTALESTTVALADFLTTNGAAVLTNKTLNWYDNTISTIPIEGGGTGATTLAAAQVALGINLKADAVNAILQGVPVADTAPAGTNTTRLATTEFVTGALADFSVGAGALAPSDATPLTASGLGLAGTSAFASRADHRHPVETTLMPKAGGTFTGTVNAVTESDADNTTKLATTAWVRTRIGLYAVPQSQVTNLATDLAAKAPINNPTFTGTPLLTTTPAPGDNTTKIASTAFVTAAITQAGVGSLGLTVSEVGTAAGPIGTVGVSGNAAHADHVHPHDTTKQDVITEAAHLAGVTKNLSTVAYKDSENTWTAQQTPMNGALTFGAPTAWDCDVTGQVASLTTGGSNFTLSNPTNVIANTCYILVVTQGATARVITWSANYLFPGGVDPVLTATAAAIDVFTFIGTSAGKMLCVGVAKGLA